MAVDIEIESLELSDTARTAAYTLRAACPSVKFASGRRSKSEQARVMASNVLKNRKWIEQTYASTPASRKCQMWVDAHPEVSVLGDLAFGLFLVLNPMTDDQVECLSRHLSGDAFDVQPVNDGAEEIKAAMRALPNLDKFLDTEGGLVRWHVQFKRLTPTFNVG